MPPVIAVLTSACLTVLSAAPAESVPPRPTPQGASAQGAASPDPVAVRRPEPWSATVLDDVTEGGLVPLGPGRGARAAVVIFLSNECPISNRYVPELNRLAAAWAGKPVTLQAVMSDPGLTRTAAAGFRKEFDLRWPVLFDASGEAAARLRPTHVPEAFVLRPDGTVAYRGRIDDWYVSPGRNRPEATRHDLADAVEAVLAGKSPAEARTAPVGCRFETAPATPATLPDKVTWHRHVAPIVLGRCADCHRAGEVAPFALTTFADAAKRARDLVSAVAEKRMPPWLPEPSHGLLAGERIVTPRERALLAKWAETGAAEGDPADAPPAPRPATDVLPGKPDLVLAMPEAFTVPAAGPDLLQNFVIPVDIPGDRMVTAIRFRPGNRRAVHHALCFLDRSGRARQLDAAEPGPGYRNTVGLGFLPSGSLGGWAPGTVARPLPDGYGRHLARGSDLVLQVHYHPTGKPETDRSTVEVWFARRPAERLVGGIALENWKIDIPPGAKDHRLTDEWVLPREAILLGVAPHMHLLGRSMRVRAVRPDGTETVLLDIRRWDFAWQDNHLLAEPMVLPAGTRLTMEAVLDNSADNPSNPSRPPVRVKWGEGTTDEMAMVIFEVSAARVEDLLALIGEDFRRRRILERAKEQHDLRNRAGR